MSSAYHIHLTRASCVAQYSPLFLIPPLEYKETQSNVLTVEAKHLSIHLSFYLPTYLSICMSLYPCFYPRICSSMYIYIYRLHIYIYIYIYIFFFLISYHILATTEVSQHSARLPLKHPPRKLSLRRLLSTFHNLGALEAWRLEGPKREPRQKGHFSRPSTLRLFLVASGNFFTYFWGGSR